MIKAKVVQITDTRLRAVREGFRLLTSLEGENPGGSIKDHMVEGELLTLLKSQTLKAGDTVSEISSGSTALSLAHFADVYGLNCVLFVPHGLDDGKQELLRSLGAELHFVDPVAGYAEYDAYLKSASSFGLNQFGNRNLKAHYASLSKQVLTKIDSVVGTVGTGHSLVGVADGFRLPPNAPTISAEPQSAGAVPGIRNVRLENFGDTDPCDVSVLSRIELAPEDYFQDDLIQTSEGPVKICETFRLVLGAVEKSAKTAPPHTVFAVGASNRRKVQRRAG